MHVIYHPYHDFKKTPYCNHKDLSHPDRLENNLSFTLDRLDNLYLLEYVSAGVVANLGKALDEFCATLVAEGELEDCNLPPPDPPIPKPRIWSHWSNFGEGTDYRAQVKYQFNKTKSLKSCN